MDISGISGPSAAAGLVSLQSQAPKDSLSQPGGDHEAAGKKFEALIATMLVKEMR